MRLDNEQLSGRNGKQAGQWVTVTFEGRLDRMADVMCVRVGGHTYALPDSAELRFALEGERVECTCGDPAPCRKRCMVHHVKVPMGRGVS